MSNASNEIAMTDKAAFSKRSRWMLGLSLHGWENFVIASLAGVAFFGALVGVASWAVVKLQRIEIAESKKEFDKYKIDAGKEIATARSDADTKIVAARSDADAKIGVAREEARTAIERAQADIAKSRAAETEAAERIEILRNKNLAFEAALSPRELGLVTNDIESMKRFAGIKVTVRFAADGEPRRLAGQIRFVLRQAGWPKLPGPLPEPYNRALPQTLSFWDGVQINPGIPTIAESQTATLSDFHTARDAASALAEMLKSKGVDVKVGPAVPIGTNTMYIAVGFKPLPPSLAVQLPNAPSAGGIHIYASVFEDE